jgi:hypothetical protein
LLLRFRFNNWVQWSTRPWLVSHRAFVGSLWVPSKFADTFRYIGARDNNFGKVDRRSEFAPPRLAEKRQPLPGAKNDVSVSQNDHAN